MNPVFEAVRSGDLDRALERAEAAVRESPSCPLQRSVLADVLLIRGELERAETHLAATLRFDPGRQREIDSTLQLLRAESDRQQVFREGRSPDFLVPPDEAMRLRLGAIAHARVGEPDEAARLLAEAAEREPVYLAAVGEGEPAPFQDWDSRFGATIEGLTTTGRCYWIPLSIVRSIEFAPVGTLRDLAYRSAVVTLGDSQSVDLAATGNDGSTRTGGGGGLGPNVVFVFMPTRYPGSETSADGTLRAGVATEWTEPRPGVGLGVGQRTFLCGDETHAAVTLVSVRAASGTATAGEASRG